MRLTYNQVSGPNTSAALAGITAANRGIGDGIAAVGSGLSNLGRRREARNRERYNEEQARALETIKLQSQTAINPNELQAVAASGGPGGQLPIGAADFIFDRQKQLLDNDSIRASTEGVRATTASTTEGTRGKRILNDGAQDELNKAQASDEFQREYSGDLLAIGNLASQGKTTEAQAALDRVLGSASSKYGSDVVIGTIDAMNARTRDGDTTRTQIGTNITALDQGRANLESTRISNTGGRISNQGNNQRNTEAAYAFDRLKADNIQNDIVSQTVAKYLSGATSEGDAFLAVRNDPSLSAEEKVRIGAGLRTVFTEDPSALDTFNPIDPLNQNAIDVAANNPAGDNINFAASTDFVNGALDSELRRSPSQQIYRGAQEISPETEYVDIGKTIRERYPERNFSDQDINRIDDVRRNAGITKREAITIVDRSIGGRGFGLHSVLPGGKRGDDRVFDKDKFNKIVDTYTQEISQGNLEVDRGEFERTKQRSKELQTEYAEAIRSRARAVQSGNEKDIAKYDRILQNLTLEARFVEANSANLEGVGRQRPQSTVERLTDPFASRDNFIDDVIGITPRQEELRTVRSLR